MRKPQFFPFCLWHCQRFGMDQLGKRMVNLNWSPKSVKWETGCKNEWSMQYHSWTSLPGIQIISCYNFFKAENVHLLFKHQNCFLKENNPWILNKWKLVARLVILSRIILSSGGNSTNCVLAHTKLVVWWTTKLFQMITYPCVIQKSLSPEKSVDTLFEYVPIWSRNSCHRNINVWKHEFKLEGFQKEHIHLLIILKYEKGKI